MDCIERTLQMVTSQLARFQIPPSVAVPVPDPVPPSSCTVLSNGDRCRVRLLCYVFEVLFIPASLFFPKLETISSLG
jgi:hypothetical protein